MGISFATVPSVVEMCRADIDDLSIVKEVTSVRHRVQGLPPEGDSVLLQPTRHHFRRIPRERFVQGVDDAEILRWRWCCGIMYVILSPPKMITSMISNHP